MNKYIILLFLIGVKPSYSQKFNNISNVEIFFELNRTQIDSIIKDNNYTLISKDLKKQTYVYHSIYHYNPYDSFIWNVTAIYKGNKLEHFMWNDMISSAIFMSQTISEEDYKILEEKTNDELGVFYLQNTIKKLDVIIYRSLPNLAKKQFSFYMLKRPNQ